MLFFRFDFHGLINTTFPPPPPHTSQDSQFGQTFFVLLRRQGGSFGLEITLSDQGYIVVVVRKIMCV